MRANLIHLYLLHKTFVPKVIRTYWLVPIWLCHRDQCLGNTYQYSQMCCTLQTADQGESRVNNWNVWGENTTAITQLPLKHVMLLWAKLPQESTEYLPKNKKNYTIWWRGLKPDRNLAAVVLCVTRHQLYFPFRKISFDIFPKLPGKLPELNFRQ